VLSGRGLCDELITRPEESYRLWWSRNLVNEGALPHWGLSHQIKKLVRTTPLRLDFVYLSVLVFCILIVSFLVSFFFAVQQIEFTFNWDCHFSALAYLAVAVCLHKVAAGDLGLEQKEYSLQPGERKQVNIQKKYRFISRGNINKLKYELIHHAAVYWLFCLHLRGWAQCKARWRINRQQNGAVALKKNVNIVTMKTWEITYIIHAG